MPPGRARRSRSSTSWRATWSCATRRGSTPTTPTTATPRWARRCPTRDPNQSITIVDQLDEGVRSLEIDTHLFTSPQDPRVGPRGPVVCHARGEDQGHAGCTTEKPLVVVLREVRELARPPSQAGAAALPRVAPRVARRATRRAPTRSRRRWAALVYRPESRGARCEPLPLELTRDQVRAARKQVVIMGPCGEGNRWQGLVFDEEARKTGSDNSPFRDFPNCGPDFTRSAVRPAGDPLLRGRDPAVARGEPPHRPDRRAAGRRDDPLRRGPDRVRLPPARRPPAGRARVELGARGALGRVAARCSVRAGAGRRDPAPSATARPAATRRATGSSRARGYPRRAAPRACASTRVVNGVPRTGFEGQQLRAAMLAGPRRQRLARPAPLRLALGPAWRSAAAGPRSPARASAAA